MQLGLFDALRMPPVIKPVKPYGDTVKGEPDETLILPHPKMAWDRARIELHRHEDGLWMWSASYMCDWSGHSYRVGPKWGKFAETRDDALFYAVKEIEERLGDKNSADAKLIVSWAKALSTPA